jgi:CubicO group peptidase (beta-lactamase class C family)
MKVTEVFWGSRAWIGLLILSLLAFIFVEMITGSVSSKPQLRPGDPLNAFLSHMNDRVPALIEQYQIPGCSIALLQNNKIVWLQAYGYADLDSGRILTWDTRFPAVSLCYKIIK